MKHFLITLSVLLFSGLAMAQQGIKDFTILDASTQKEVSLYQYKSKKAIVIIFMGNFCPYTKLYHERIKALEEKYKNDEVAFILINPNTQGGHPDESPAETVRIAQEEGFKSQVWIDRNQAAIKVLNPSKTPECFVLDQGVKNELRIAYRGAIDDNPQVEGDVSSAYLADAIAAVLAGRNPKEPNTRPTGCLIKK
ncbi:redoxin family protein [Cytophagales bacterium LB-30]|uniref:Redoxin family protein n=1 Tax=Shiella aurantiaca TaxID=3058365 RepID=A0ABT8F7Q0_9BACT|nr:redoxin family protein [Shiella aurantiaca]MDN4166512.1 redoxin family protein [Shiella aurantiaca]